MSAEDEDQLSHRSGLVVFMVGFADRSLLNYIKLQISRPGRIRKATRLSMPRQRCPFLLGHCDC